MGLGVIAALLLVAMVMLVPARASANPGAGGQVSVGISVRFGPPPLPVYAQPMCPGPGYLWTPGYWAWDPAYGYYWVPGTWVRAPFRGALWTPGYWGWNPAAALFVWHRGYWGLRVGFYGGIDYGFGYFGRGYVGGRWDRDRFFYNRAFNQVNVVNITHVYYRDVRHERRERRISYNGGRGGIDARPTREDRLAERGRRMGPIRSQERQERMARGMPAFRWSVNHGRPDVAATPRPERFRDRGVVRATRAGGPYRAEQPRGRARPEGGARRSFGERPAARRRPAQPANRSGQERGYAQRSGNGSRREATRPQPQRQERRAVSSPRRNERSSRQGKQKEKKKEKARARDNGHGGRHR